MKTNITCEEYKKMYRDIYNLIIQEIESTKYPESTYPKAVIMYEFFRLLRGESFSDYIAPGCYRDEAYKMEDSISEKLNELKSKITRTDTAEYELEIMRKSLYL